jgi:transposase
VGTAVEAVRGPDAAGGQPLAAGGVPGWLLWLCARLAVALAEVARLRGERDAALVELAELRARVALFEHLLFGQSSERAGHGASGDGSSAGGGSGGQPPAGASGGGAAAGGAPGQGGAGGTRPGGRRGPGARAGRRDYGDLPEADGGEWDFPEGGYVCPCCGAPFARNGEEVSWRLEWLVQVVRRVVRRRRYRRRCDCGGPATVVAPGPPRAIGKGLWTNRSLALLLVERYGAGRSLNSLVVGLARHGAELASPTLVGACAQAGDLLAPLAEKIVERSRGSWHLHADETTWRVFAPDGGGKPQRWWLWVFLGPDSVCFVTDPTRAGTVLAAHLGLDEDTGQLAGGDGEGPRRLVISSDFYSVYASAGRRVDGLTNLYCLAHLRRHFVRAKLANPAQLEYWERAWLDRFRALYAAHRGLSAAWAAARDTPGPGADARLAAAYAGWDQAIGAIDTARRAQQASPGLQAPAKKALATLDRQWAGVVAHRDFPQVGLDNNPAERALRRPVVTRKNAYGSRNDDAAALAATAWTVLATTELHDLNTLTYLTAYLDACGHNGGKPPSGADLDRFLPWAASPDDLATWKKPPG